MLKIAYVVNEQDKSLHKITYRDEKVQETMQEKVNRICFGNPPITYYLTKNKPQ